MSNGFQQRDMSGVLFRNDKGDNERRPDYRGELVIDGTEYELAGWIKEGKAGGKMEGKKFFSLSVQRKDGQAPAKSSAPAAELTESDVPF